MDGLSIVVNSRLDLEKNRAWFVLVLKKKKKKQEQPSFVFYFCLLPLYTFVLIWFCLGTRTFRYPFVRTGQL